MPEDATRTNERTMTTGGGGDRAAADDAAADDGAAWRALGVDDGVARALCKMRMGAPTATQRSVVPRALEGRDVVARAHGEREDARVPGAGGARGVRANARKGDEGVAGDRVGADA